MRHWGRASASGFKPGVGAHWLSWRRAGSPDWPRGLRPQIPERGRAANMAAERGAGQQQSQEMMEVDRRVESEESGDEEGKKQSSGIVADLSEQSLKDGEEQGEEDPEGTRPKGQELPVDMETISLDRDAEDIDLNHYRIGKIEGFEVLKKVKTLCLRQNLIKCIENLGELQSLRELDLYDNQIKKIENLEALTHLEILDISFNLLRNIEGVDKLTRLRKLFLVNNKISKIENISNLHQLQMLELGSNRIRAIENIDTLTSLESLFLGKNKITKLQNLDALTNLTVLSMQSNRLTKMEGLQSLVNLRELYLSHNGIEVIEGLENNNKLTMLDIASNRIKKIENVSHLTELQEFWVSGMHTGLTLLLQMCCLQVGCRERGQERSPGASRRARRAGTVTSVVLALSVGPRHRGAESQAPRYPRWGDPGRGKCGTGAVRSVRTCPSTRGEVAGFVRPIVLDPAARSDGYTCGPGSRRTREKQVVGSHSFLTRLKVLQNGPRAAVLRVRIAQACGGPVPRLVAPQGSLHTPHPVMLRGERAPGGAQSDRALCGV
uniref:Protein phosphatase 1 regulatory subunit 7 n=2 Tax=Canis lupus familiaris TaxID=9615 RepID=A0A8C0MYH8_CANLF